MDGVCKRKPVARLGIQVEVGLIRVLLLRDQEESARLTLPVLSWMEELWGVGELCRWFGEEPSVVLFADGLPGSSGPSTSSCSDEDCGALHTTCTAAQREFGWLRERLLRVSSWR